MTMQSFRWAIQPLALALALTTAPSFAADQSTDEELMESLDSELLDGLETIPADDEEAGASGELQPSDLATDDTDEFTRISRRMRELERMIPQLEKKQPTAKLQKDVIAELEKLIAALEQQCQKCQGGANSCSKASQQTANREQVKQPGQKPCQNGEQNSNKPARDSTERLGKDEAHKPDMEQMKGLLKDLWGQLPEKARDQMLQSSPEQFLPKYELLIEDYYRKLSEKQPR
jgi:hypothetical protein